ncbi:MAG: hypothetical protein WC470_03625 [Candidatus Paceibacterota bacterium]
MNSKFIKIFCLSCCFGFLFFANQNVLAAACGTGNLYTTPGTCTWTVPAGVASVDVEVCGGGGGGGGGGEAMSTTDKCCFGEGGHGGLASQCVKSTKLVKPGEQYEITVGRGGAGGAPAADGSNGGSSSFGSIISAGGLGNSRGSVTAFTSDQRNGGKGFDGSISGISASAGAAARACSFAAVGAGGAGGSGYGAGGGGGGGTTVNCDGNLNAGAGGAGASGYVYIIVNQAYVPASCGPATKTNPYSEPTSYLCNAGEASQVNPHGGNEYYDWFCTGSDGFAKYCSNEGVQRDTAVCGPSTKDTTYNLDFYACYYGTRSDLTGSGYGPFSWKCTGNDKKAITCSSPGNVLQCGAASKKSFATAPTTDLCVNGTSKSGAFYDSKTNKFNWACQQGTDVFMKWLNCSAAKGTSNDSDSGDTPPVVKPSNCGRAHQSILASFQLGASSSSLCVPGVSPTLNDVAWKSGGLYFTWKCGDSSCESATACGSVSGQVVSVLPENGLCKVGVPIAKKYSSTIDLGRSGTISNAFSWNCSDGTGGTITQCYATTAKSEIKINADSDEDNNLKIGSLVLDKPLNEMTKEELIQVLLALLKLKLSDATDGVCGTANQKTFETAPTTTLCSLGTPSAVTQPMLAYPAYLGGNRYGSWTWTCSGTNGGKSASCCAAPGKSGLNTCACGPALNVPTATQPSSNTICAKDARSTTPRLSGDNWFWSCSGSLGQNSCLAPVTAPAAEKDNGVCGSANGKVFTSAPTENLCSVGVPSSVNGTGPWTWTCDNKKIGETPVACSTKNSNDDPSQITPPVSDPPIGLVNGVCGAANNTFVSAKPSVNLCVSGIKSVVGGTGPWTWTCDGQNGGSTASCSAKKTYCIESDKSDGYYTKGLVNYNGTLMSDYCSGKNVIKYYCSTTGPQTRELVCPWGCKEGVCSRYLQQ